MYAVCLLALYIVVLSGDGIEAIIRSDADNVVGLLLDEQEQRNGVLDPDAKIKQTPIVSPASLIYADVEGYPSSRHQSGDNTQDIPVGKSIDREKTSDRFRSLLVASPPQFWLRFVGRQPSH